MSQAYPNNYVMLPAPPADGYTEVGAGRTLTADVVIVGSGPGGAAAAKVLAKNGLRVVIVEAGPKTSNFRPNYAHTAKYHMQENGAIVARGSSMIPIAAGRGLGGSTLINSALCFRAPDKVLKKWRTVLEDEYWGPESMKPLYDRLEEYIGVSITSDIVAGENNKLIVNGIKKLGYDGGFAPRSTPRCGGCGICYYGCPVGGKASTNFNFLPEAVEAGALIQAETRVVEVLVKNRTAIGVRGIAIHPETKELGGEVIVHAKRVVLAAGAIGTPRLLWSSGLAKHMGSMVGEGLQIHPGSTILGVADHPIKMWTGATQGAYFHPPNLPGVLPHTFSAPPEACLVAGGFVGDKLQQGFELLPYLCGMLVMVSDQGTGRVRAFADGRADIVYNFHPTDVQRIKDGLIEVAKVLLAGGAKDLRAPVHQVGIFNHVDQLRAQLTDRTIQDFTLYAAHPMGTCRMGKSPQNSVIDPSGQSHHIHNLYISDASVFPSSLGVNPQLSTMAVSTQIARRMVQS